MKTSELKQLIKEMLINELDISKYLSSWIDTKTLKKTKNFPESVFLYLKKEGYTNKGEIYRVLTLDHLVVILKQNTEYIDLDKFLEDNQDIEPYDDLYSSYQDEKEVIARLDSNFSFEDIHYASPTGMNMNMFLGDLDKNKLKNDILKKDQGKLLSFTKDREAANYIFYTAIDHLEDNDFLNEGKQIGLLYHYTDIKNIKNILDKGLKFSKPQEEILSKYYISTTRKKQNWKHLAEIVLDGNKISQNYKIIPINASTFIDKPSNEWFKQVGVKIDSLGGSELAEERIISSSPGYLDPKYILKIN